MDYMKPIIEIYHTKMQTEFEGEVMKAVCKIGVNVDKERLIQALTDAKKFYNEGYADGRRSATKYGHWIVGRDGSYMCSECNQVFRYEIGNYCSSCGAELDTEEIG